MSFWNLYTEQNKTPVYIATDYNKMRSELRHQDSQGSKPSQNSKKNRLSNCSEETYKLEECAEENQPYFRHFSMNVPECHDQFDSYNTCLRQKKSE